MAMSRLIQDRFIAVNMVHPFELLTAANGPGNRSTGDIQLGFHFVQQLHRVTDITVELVHKSNDWRIAQAGNFHQFARAILYPFCRVDNHQARIHCG